LLTPRQTAENAEMAELFSDLLKTSLTVQDISLSSSAFSSANLQSPFNLTDVEGRQIGELLGTQAFLLIDSETIRRSDSQRPEYYESFVSVYVVNSRSGSLMLWKLINAEAGTPVLARAALLKRLPQFKDELVSSIKAQPRLMDAASATGVEIISGDDAATKDSRQPVPFKRVKPEYTQTAYLYDISATVDIIVDLDEDGRIKRTEIVRWAGFGLDEAVEKAVRSMNWRPAERNGKFVPARFLLRYNFKRPDKK
jgi:TonB family protein